MLPWTDPQWLAEATEWIHEQLASLGVRGVGPVVQHHLQPWSTVLRLSTDNGDVYFKANSAPLRQEAAVVTVLSARRPDCVEAPLAVDLDRGWMLMADAGTRLRDVVRSERDLLCWLEILPLYAGLQIDLAADADRLLGLGAPDLRLATLAARFEQLLETLTELPVDTRQRLRANLGRVSEMCDQLAGYGLPETIQHDDFHDGQVFVREGRYVLLDWGDACVSHPFFTLSVTLEGVLAWGPDDKEGSVDIAPFRDAYLEPFTRFAEAGDLRAACATALRLGWLCRAINGHLGGSEAAQTQLRLRMFLEGGF